MELKNDFINFISKTARIPQAEIQLETRIYNSALVSSLVILEIISFMEKHFNIWVKPEELIEENFMDVGTSIRFIERKLNSQD